MQAPPLSTTAARNLNPSDTRLSISEGPGLAHDAGNLLGALGLYCDLLDLPGVLRPEHLHYARELRLLSQRSGALISRLLVDGQAPLSRPCIKRRCPATVVRAFAPLLRSLATPEASVSVAVASALPTLPFAAEVLERILVNLTRNAASALRQQPPLDACGNEMPGQIHIGICGDATHLRLTVMDNGPGMPTEVAAEFLKPTPLPRGALSGLGHRVIHDLVESTGGELSIDTIPHRGTTLQIDWPISAGKAKSNVARTTLNTVSSPTEEHLSNFSEDPPHEGAELSC